MSEIYVCEKTGFYNKVARKTGHLRKKGHLKKLYCVKCNEYHNFRKIN